MQSSRNLHLSTLPGDFQDQQFGLFHAFGRPDSAYAVTHIFGVRPFKGVQQSTTLMPSKHDILQIIANTLRNVGQAATTSQTFCSRKSERRRINKQQPRIQTSMILLLFTEFGDFQDHTVGMLHTYGGSDLQSAVKNTFSAESELPKCERITCCKVTTKSMFCVSLFEAALALFP